MNCFIQSMIEPLSINSDLIWAKEFSSTMPDFNVTLITLGNGLLYIFCLHFGKSFTPNRKEVV